MTYTPEQVIEVKRQIFEQTAKLPEDQKKQIEDQVNKMSADELEGFVAQQMAASGGQQAAMPGGSGDQKGIFRMIVEGDVPSKKIDENDFAIVVVSKRAVTKGHVLVIPKSAVGDEKEMPESVGKLADSIAKRLKSKMKARDVKREITKAFGEIVIDLIPDYGDGIDKGKAYEASDEEIQEVHDKLWVSKVEKPKVIKIKKKKANIKPIKLKRRIP